MLRSWHAAEGIVQWVGYLPSITKIWFQFLVLCKPGVGMDACNSNSQETEVESRVQSHP